MIVPSGSQLARIKTRPHRTRLWLGIYEPRVVVSARLSANVKSTVDLTVTYLTGAPGDIEADMTAYIGTSAGGQDLGRIRVKSGSAGEIKVSENSINWQANWYITVVEYYEPWSVFPRIVLDANNVPIFYKDYDVLYTDQNQYLDPIVHMGPNHAGFLVTGSYCVYYSSSGSFDPTPDSPSITGSSYEWNFGDEGVVDPTGTTEQDPGYVCYLSGGFHTTSLTITTEHGESFTGHRHVMIYDRPGEGPLRPYVEWGLNSLDGSRGDGGYQARIWLRERAGFSKVKDGSLVVVFSDDWQGTDEGAIGGNAENRDSILFVGYIDTGSIALDPVTNKLEFDVSGITNTMKEVSNYSASLESKTNAGTWWEMREMTVDRALIHMLRWQSTVLALADFHQTGDLLNTQYADFDRGGLYDTANQFLESTLGAQMVGDRQGAIYCEIDLNLIPTGSNRLDYLTALDVERRDWRENIAFDFLPNSPMAYIEMGGIAYSGPSTGTTDAYLAGAPGDAQLWRGSIERGSGLVLSGQDQLNVLTANMLAQANSEFPDLDIPLAGDYRFIDIAPQRRVTLTLEESETYRGYVWNQKKFIPQSMTFNYEPSQQSLLTDLTVKEETFATETGKADTILIPEDPPYTNYKLPEWSIEFPPFIPPDPMWPPIEPPPVGEGALVYVLFQQQLARTRNFWDDSPSWEDVVVPGDLSVTRFTGFRLDPSNPMNSALLVTENKIWRTDNLDAVTPSWSVVYSDALYPTHKIETVQHIQPWIAGRLWSAACIRAASASGCPINFAPCHYHARAGAGATGWEFFRSGMSEGNKGSPAMIQPTAWAGGTAYFGGQKQLYQTIDVGVNFTLRDNTLTAWPHPMAHLGNSGGSALYYTRDISPGGDKLLRYSANGGVTSISISPLYDGVYWYPRINQYTNAPQQAECFWIHPLTGVGYAAMTGPGKGYGIFAQYANGAWQVKAQFNGPVGPMMIHFADDGSKQYLMGDAANERIMGSEDGGFTWYDKIGDFEVAVRSLTGIGYPTCMQVVWVV